MIRLALLGCPEEAERYARLARRLRGVRFAAVADGDAQRARDCAQAVKADLWSDDYDRLLDEQGTSFDAVVVQGAGQDSLRICEVAIRAGKHVLLQGCLPDSATVMTELVLASGALGVHLMVGNSLRFLTAVRAIKQSLEAGRLGEPGCLRMHHWTSRATTGGIQDLGSSPAALAKSRLCWHFGEIDAVCWLFGGAPSVVYATGRLGSASESGLDYVQLHLEFAGGGMALVDLANTLPPGAGYFALTLVGSSGTAYADDHHNMQLLFAGGLPVALHASQGDESLRSDLEEFSRAIVEDREPAIGGADGLRAIKVIDAVVESLLTRQALHRVNNHDRSIGSRATNFPNSIDTRVAP